MEFEIVYYDLKTSPEVDRRVMVAKGEETFRGTRISIHMAVFDRSLRRPNTYLYTGSAELTNAKSGEVLERFTELRERSFTDFEALKTFILALLNEMAARAKKLASGNLINASDVPLFSEYIDSIDAGNE
ncbi:MAG: hypothetical protein AAF633_08245 [Chloroflexota bacterium]